MKDKYELIGQKFGRLTVKESLGVIDFGNERRAGYLCSCECGNERKVSVKNLKEGRVESCGCIRSASPDAREKVKAQKRADAKRRKDQRNSILKDLGYTEATPYKDLFDDLNTIRNHWRLKIDFGVLINSAARAKETENEL